MKNYKSIFKENNFPKKDEIFARKNKKGYYDILYIENGDIVTRLDSNIIPINSDLSVKYEHPEGIKLSLNDVKKLKIPIE